MAGDADLTTSAIPGQLAPAAASACYVMASLRMLGPGHARTGAVVMARQPSSAPGQGPITAQPAASTACGLCYPESPRQQPAQLPVPGTAAPDHDMHSEQPPGLDLTPAEQLASGVRTPLGQQPHQRFGCSPVQPGCVLGFVTSGWQEGMPATCPAQAVLRLEGLPARCRGSVRDELPSFGVAVWDHRSGLLHGAEAHVVVLE